MIKSLEPYLVELNKNRLMKTTKYSNVYTIGGDKYCLVIIISHNKCTFSKNNRI